MNIIKKLLTDYKIFKIYMIIQILVQTILVPVAPWMGLVGNSIISIWAFLIIAYDYFHEKILFTGKYRFLLYLFLVSVLLSIALNAMNLTENIQTVIMLVIQLFVLFSGVKTSKDELHKDLFWTSNILGIVLFICSLIGFTMYCSNITIYKYTGRYCGIFSNPNIASVLSLAGAVLSILALCYSHNLKSKLGRVIYKIVHITSAIMNFVMFTFANSNNGKLMMALFASSLIFVVCLLIMKFKNMVVKVLISSVMAVAVGLFSLFAFNFMQQTFANLPSIIDSVITMISNKGPALNQEETIPPSQKFEREEEQKLDNGRVTIWKQGLNAYVHAPVFGCGPRNVFNALSKYNDTVHVSVDVGGLHNMFLELLVTTGVVGFLLYMIFFIGIICVIMKYVFKKSTRELNKRNKAILSVLIGSVVMLIAMNFGESIMLFSASPYAMLFWLFFGYLFNYVRLGASDKIELPERKGISKWM
ncbi:MAG: O-antigen ligase family protein [Oscillospiraceae bacterium]